MHAGCFLERILYLQWCQTINKLLGRDAEFTDLGCRFRSILGAELSRETHEGMPGTFAAIEPN
jgi:hypothetical protein